MPRSASRLLRQLDPRFRPSFPGASAPTTNAGASATGEVLFRSALGTAAQTCVETLPLSAPSPPLAKLHPNAIAPIAEAAQVPRQRRFGWDHARIAPGRPRDAEASPAAAR